MADRRIRIASDKSDFVKELLNDKQAKGPFQYQADVIAFAAAVGVSINTRVPLKETTKEPIRQSVFDGKGYDVLMNVLAVHAKNDASVLANNEKMDDVRATIFEEYANAGLEHLSKQLKGHLTYLDPLLLLTASQRAAKMDDETDFNLDSFLE